MKQSDMTNYLVVWDLQDIEDHASLPERLLTSGKMPFPSQFSHFACCTPVPLQRWHDWWPLAPICPLHLQIGQVVRMNPVPLQVPHLVILAVLFLQRCEVLC